MTSAVVVVKPPGSDWEMEFKRAGTRGARLLDVITEREGREAPVSHRLFGGSLDGWENVRLRRRRYSPASTNWCTGARGHARVPW